MSIESNSGQSYSGKIPATLNPGDGIGPEITEAVVEVLDALGAPFTSAEQPQPQSSAKPWFIGSQPVIYSHGESRSAALAHR